jgi:uncharacterized membrane protein
MDAKTLNSIGLILNILGVALMFFRAFPQPSFEEGVGVRLEDNTPTKEGMTAAECDRQTLSRKKLYQCLSVVGLVLVLLGFAFQLLASLK